MSIFPTIYGIAVLGAVIVFVAAAIAGAVVANRRRVREIRSRDYPAFEGWLKTHYPKATSEQEAVIRRTMEAFGHLAGVEPTQLLPKDRIVGFVLPPTWQAMLIIDNEYGDLYDHLDEILGERRIELAEWELLPCDSWETIADAIDFMLKRTCAVSAERTSKLSA